jgi:glucose-1-phosphate cytidylyltransferase
MKVVLFCGGLGTRLREVGDTVPKPMVAIGGRPILWHLMKYYAHFGHTEFILCLGHRGEVIRRELATLDTAAWSITCADTGIDASVGERLRAVQPLLGHDPVFLANYSDGLSDLPLADQLAQFERSDHVASFAAVRPSQSFHTATLDSDGRVRSIQPVSRSGLWINGGFFAFRREIFDHLHAGEDLVDEPFQRLIAAGRLNAWRHEGFWACMDTPKDKAAFDTLEAEGRTPWKVWAA